MADGDYPPDRPTSRSDEEEEEVAAAGAAPCGGSYMASPRARGSREREEEVAAASAVTSSGSSMAGPPRARGGSKQEEEVAAVDVVPSGGSSMASPLPAHGSSKREEEVAAAGEEKTMKSIPADPRARVSGKEQEEVAAVAARGSSDENTTTILTADPRARPSREREKEVAAARASHGADPRASGKRRRHEDVEDSAAAPAPFEDSRPSLKRRLQEEEHTTITSSEVVRAHQLLSLPEHLTARIMRCLPIQMALWQLDHQPSDFRFQLRDGLYPSPDELALFLNNPDLLRIRRFSLLVSTDAVTDLHMAGYLTKASQCLNEELCLEYHHSVNSLYVFRLTGCRTCLVKLHLKNITVSHDSLAVTPVFPVLSIIRFSSVRIDSRSLTQVIALCPSINTLSLHDIGLLDEIYFEPPVSTLRSLTITICSNITLLDIQELCGLRYFFYIGPLATMNFSVDASVKDMVMCSREEEHHGDPVLEWLEAPPDFSMLSVLTLSSSCLYALTSGTMKNLHLDNLKELQVVFVSFSSAARAQFLAFLNDTRCPNLERMFLQLGQRNAHFETKQDDQIEDLEIELRSLLLIRAEHFDGNIAQMDLLSMLLLKAPTLDNMILCSTGDQAGLQMKVALLKKCSEVAEVLLMQDSRNWPEPRHLIPSDFSSIKGAE